MRRLSPAAWHLHALPSSPRCGRIGAALRLLCRGSVRAAPYRLIGLSYLGHKAFLLTLSRARGKRIRAPRVGERGSSPTCCAGVRMTKSVSSTDAHSLSARAFSHADMPCLPAFRRYRAFSAGVQRKCTRAVDGFLTGGLPRLGLSMPGLYVHTNILTSPSCGPIICAYT